MKVHLADTGHSFTACGLRIIPSFPSHAGISTSADREEVTCLRCLGGAYASREKRARHG